MLHTDSTTSVYVERITTTLRRRLWGTRSYVPRSTFPECTPKCVSCDVSSTTRRDTA